MAKNTPPTDLPDDLPVVYPKGRKPSASPLWREGEGSACRDQYDESINAK